MPSQNYSRLKALQSQLKEEGCIVDEPIDLFYLTGLKLSLGRLIVTKKKACLFVDGRYLEACQKNKNIKTQLVSKEAILKFTAKLKTVGFDSQVTTVAEYETLQKWFGKKLKTVPYLLQNLRLIKDKTEVNMLKKSARLLWKGFKYVQKFLKVGVTEEFLAKKFETFCLENGASGMAFDPIIAFGENSAMPHCRAGKRKLKKGDLVLVDIGVMIDSYASDMTRVLYFGKADPRLLQMESVVRAAHKAALQLCRPGVRLGKLDEAARKVMRKAKMEHLYVHSLGHGIGLEVHEYPRIKYDGKDKDVILEAGMAITIEPGLYLPGVGGVRHEDTIVITPSGYQNLYTYA